MIHPARTAIFFAFLLGLLFATSSLQAAEPAQTVKLVIDYGDGVQKHFTKLPFKDEMTVLDAMRLADKHSRGIDYKYSGSGATAFLTSIDGVENKGAGGDNWIFRVNGRLGNSSFGALRVFANDEINWTFGEYKP